MSNEQITLKQLKSFQIQAAGDLASMIQEFPGGKFRPRFDPETGLRQPFLCRLRAITGAGKTPILALAAQRLQTGIILWTTNRGAIIAQTKANLQPGGKYADLLPPDTQVFDIGQMAPQDWTEAMQSERGLTILLATVASFNQEGDTLRIHQPRGNTTYWKMLGGLGDEGRRRQLYVFYDEGHGATAKQFRKLRELSPRAFVLASFSDLPDEFYDLLPGATKDDQAQSLQARTVLVSTPEVVAAGLLKTRLYLMDCEIAHADTIADANAKWNELAAKFSPMGDVPIACFIVNSTARGVEIWEELVKQNVPASRIAVHLNGAEATMLERRGHANGLIDTLKAKKTPDDLRAAGYTHLIWNLSLREGWDEPMAYVAYIDDEGKSQTDMVQKIGRFVRQPNARPFEDADLNSAYFYFNVPDEEFESLINNMQAEMSVEGYEIIAVKGETRPKTSRLVDVKQEITVPAFGEHFGDNQSKLDKIVLEHVPLFAAEALCAKGYVDRRVFDVERLQEDTELRQREERDNNESVSVYEFVLTRLGAIDSRLVGQERFSPILSEDRRMRQKMQYGSDAMTHMANQMQAIRDRLNDEFRLASLGRHGAYPVKPFNLVSPDISGVTDALREKYRVRRYVHAVHEEYNGLNPFEVQVAAALDTLGYAWCRNPQQSGYKIPIAELGADVHNFYPDFLLWTEKEVWAIDPKGTHLKEAAAQQKLFDVSDAGGAKPVRVTLIVQGNWTVSKDGSWNSSNKKDGFTLARRISGNVKTQLFTNLNALVKSLVEE